MRLAKAEDATLMPAFLARVPLHLPLDSPLPAQCCGRHAAARGDRAARRGARASPVDARIGRGRTYRDALQRLLDDEHFDRIIVSATDSPRVGLSSDDLLWLLDRVPAEVMILRPAPEDERRISANGVEWALLRQLLPRSARPLDVAYACTSSPVEVQAKRREIRGWTVEVWRSARLRRAQG